MDGKRILLTKQPAKMVKMVMMKTILITSARTPQEYY